jgi:NitT/TauT family transport system substrate-binding protein
MIAAGEADMGDFRLEEALALIEKGFPLLLVAVYMHQDPQAVMVHADGPIRSFEDLAGRRVMARAGMPFLEVLKKRYKMDFSLLPLNGAGALFLNDKEIAQQCFITNEPFYAERAGVKVRTLHLSDAGLDLFRVIGVKKSFAEKHPERVRAFLAGMIAGWEDYLYGDDFEAAHEMILTMNPALDEEGMRYAREVMIREKIIEGKDNPHGIGYMDMPRLEGVIELLTEINFLTKPMDASSFTTMEYLEPAS